MEQTSLDAYRSVDLNTRQAEVYRIIQIFGPITNKRIAEELGWPINRVTGRVNELRNKVRSITDAGTVIDPESNRRHTLWKVKQ